MRLQIAVSVLILVLSIALGTLVLWRQPARAAPGPTTVTSVLRAFQCDRAETKRIILRGVEDDYSPAGSEPNFLRPQRQTVNNQTFFAGGSYDQVQSDRRFTDSFRLPRNIASGMFLIRMRPVGNNANDVITVGAMRDASVKAYLTQRYSTLLLQINKASPWVVNDDIYRINFADMKFHGPPDLAKGAHRTSLLDYVRSGGDEGWFDISVIDDTAVDVAALVVCVEPPRGKGTSLSQKRNGSFPERNIIALSCAYGTASQYMCDPYVGDTACATPLPVACSRPQGRPVPVGPAGQIVANIWSGGDLAFSEPVAASRFGTIRDVDRFCAARFGAGWRTTSFHDGMTYVGVAGHSTARTLTSRVWVDISDQPYATCWSR